METAVMKRGKFTSARLLLLVPVSAVLALAACDSPVGPTPTATTPVGQVPQDFSVTYEWRAGTMPPPHHYEYTVVVGADGKGSVIFRPDYPSDKVPTWTETFAVGDEEIRGLYSLVVEKNMLRDNWRELDSPPVGGSVEWAEIRASSKEHRVPIALEVGDSTVAAELYEHVKSLVPQATWDKLMSQRDEYVREYEQ
jgi:hypothetical protein